MVILKIISLFYFISNFQNVILAPPMRQSTNKEIKNLHNDVTNIPEINREHQDDYKQNTKQHNLDHENIEHPGGREQLEEVWQESDQLDKNFYNPKTFFALHDLDSDGFWNYAELKSLFQIELDKLYNNTNSEISFEEKQNEMQRMGEHVMKQIDINNDGLISLEEFLKDSEAQNGTQNLSSKEKYENDVDQKISNNVELKNLDEENAKFKKQNNEDNSVLHYSNNQMQQQNQETQASKNEQHLDSHQPSLKYKKKKVVDPIYGV